MAPSDHRETPIGTIPSTAHRELEQICLDREIMHHKEQVALNHADLGYNGQWYTPLKEALDALVNATNWTVTDEVRLKLYEGNNIITGHRSPNSLYREDFATFGEDAVCDQKK